MKIMEIVQYSQIKKLISYFARFKNLSLQKPNIKKQFK